VTSVVVKRVYAPPHAKAKAKIDLWLKDIAPSDALRKRFHGKPDDWDAFRAAYFAELKGVAAQAAAKELLDRLHSGPLTLLYAARNEEQNNAIALKAWLEKQTRGRT
jgi:uncharacterized protein YeaO (DUF488 family)